MNNNVKKETKCLVLTATIKPNAIFSAHSDMNTRANEYLDAIRFYRSRFHGNIFFLENSEYDIWEDNRFTELHEQKHIIIIKAQPSDQYEKGKGFQEFKMLDDFVLTQKDNYEIFFKITGRYIIENFSKLEKTKCNGLVIDSYFRQKSALTSYFLCNFDFYLSHLKDAYKKVNDKDGIYIEKIIYQIARDSPRTQISLFPLNPKLSGISGSTGIPLPTASAKTFFRSICRPIFRTLHITELI